MNTLTIGEPVFARNMRSDQYGPAWLDAVLAGEPNPAGWVDVVITRTVPGYVKGTTERLCNPVPGVSPTPGQYVAAMADTTLRSGSQPTSQWGGAWRALIVAEIKRRREAGTYFAV